MNDAKLVQGVKTLSYLPQRVLDEFFRVLLIELFKDLCDFLTIHVVQDYSRFSIKFIAGLCSHHLIAVYELKQIILHPQFLSFVLLFINRTSFHDKGSPTVSSNCHLHHTVLVSVCNFTWLVVLQGI